MVKSSILLSRPHNNVWLVGVVNRDNYYKSLTRTAAVRITDSDWGGVGMILKNLVTDTITYDKIKSVTKKDRQRVIRSIKIYILFTPPKNFHSQGVNNKIKIKNLYVSFDYISIKDHGKIKKIFYLCTSLS